MNQTFRYRVSLWMFILGFLILATSIYRRRWEYSFDASVLLAFCAIALALVGYSWRKMFRLDDSRSSTWATICISLVLTALLIGLLELNDRGILIWSRIYAYLPLLIATFGVAIAAWITELKKGVQIYADLGGYIFVRKP